MTKMLVLGALCAGLAALDFDGAGSDGVPPTSPAQDGPPLLVGARDASVDAMFVALAAR